MNTQDVRYIQTKAQVEHKVRCTPPARAVCSTVWSP